MPFGIARHNFRPLLGSSGENPKTALYVNSVGAANVSAARRTLINNLFNSLDSNGSTALLGRLWLFAAENSTCALVDLISLSSATVVNSPTFTANQGYAGNGTSSYVNLGTTTPGTLNSSMFAVGNRTNQGTAIAQVMGSVSGANPSSNLGVNWTDGNIYYSLNDADGDTGRAAPANRIGVYVVTRTSSTVVNCYKDSGATLGNTGQTSTSIPARNFCAGATFTSGGVAQNWTADQLSMAALGNAGGGGMTQTQAANFTGSVQTYLTAVGA